MNTLFSLICLVKSSHLWIRHTLFTHGHLLLHHHHLPPYWEPPLCLPECFSGEPRKIIPFLMQCRIQFDFNHLLFPWKSLRWVLCPFCLSQLTNGEYLNGTVTLQPVPLLIILLWNYKEPLTSPRPALKPLNSWLDYKKVINLF